MIKLCTGSLERKTFAAAICLAAAALTGIGALNHGRHSVLMSPETAFIVDSFLTAVYVFLGVLMLAQISRRAASQG